MYKHTINFQIGDKFTLKNLRSISYKKYARQINWYINMSENHGTSGEPLRYIIEGFTRYANIDGVDVKNDENICEVWKVEEDYNYLRVYLQCIHPGITSYLNRPRPRDWSVKPCKGSDAIEEHSEAWYRDREHWSEFHGFESW